MIEQSLVENPAREVIDGLALCDRVAKYRRKPEALQQVCDLVFTPERRERMMKEASRDQHERPVVYYRVVPFEVFTRTLEQGGISAETLQTLDVFYDTASAEEVGGFFRAYVQYMHLMESCEDASIEELLNAIITEDSEEKQSIIDGTATQEEVVNFILRHCNGEAVATLQALGQSFSFSPLVRTYVGATSEAGVPAEYVALEMILPDEDVIVCKQKSSDDWKLNNVVYYRGVRLECVSRVYATSDEYQTAVMRDPRMPFAQHLLENRHEADSVTDERVREWFESDSLRERLPVGIV